MKTFYDCSVEHWNILFICSLNLNKGQPYVSQAHMQKFIFSDLLKCLFLYIVVILSLNIGRKSSTNNRTTHAFEFVTKQELTTLATLEKNLNTSYLILIIYNLKTHWKIKVWNNEAVFSEITGSANNADAIAMLINDPITCLIDVKYEFTTL